jgi:hypothetical protein
VGTGNPALYGCCLLCAKATFGYTLPEIQGYALAGPDQGLLANIIQNSPYAKGGTELSNTLAHGSGTCHDNRIEDYKRVLHRSEECVNYLPLINGCD